MNRSGRWLLMALAGVLLVGGLWWSLRPQPLLVDQLRIDVAPMTVSIRAEGRTRVREVYTVSSPIAGHLDRLALNEGDPVVAGDSLLASIHPLEPPFLDTRTRAERLAGVRAAEAAVALARVERTRAEAAVALARSELRRANELGRFDAIARRELEQYENTLTLARAQLDASNAAITLREAELDSRRASLMPGGNEPPASDDTCCVHIRSPVDGIVLQVHSRNEQAVAAGTPLADVGDPRQLEAVVDIPSADAVRVAPGTPVRIDGWGGSTALQGTVRRIDPTAFTKVSALGIEEQRVNVIIELPETPDELGHGYRVVAELLIWQRDEVLPVPIGALFRDRGRWAVFVIEQQRARLRHVTLGQMNNEVAEVIDGLSSGETLVLYPNDLIADGIRIESRDASG